MYYYCNTLAKCGPWLIGLIFGYMLFHAPKYPDFNNWLMEMKEKGYFWLICSAMSTFCIFGINFLPNYTQPRQEGFPNFFHALFAAIHRPIWAIMIGLIIYSSHFISPNSLTNRFLSNPVFQFVSKISFSMYVGHMIPAYLIKVSYVLNSINFNIMTTVS